MKVVIPPSLRRVQQAWPPLTISRSEPPHPPTPEPELIDIPGTIWYILVIFAVSGVLLSLRLRNMGALVLGGGIIAIMVRVALVFRSYQARLRRYQRDTEIYLAALAVYAQEEDKYYHIVSKEHAPHKVHEYRRQLLKETVEKLPKFIYPENFIIPMEKTGLGKILQESTWGEFLGKHPILIPGLEQPYLPYGIYIGKNIRLVIVIDIDHNQLSTNYAGLSQLLIPYFELQGWLWIKWPKEETENSPQRCYDQMIEVIRSIGGNDEN